MAKRGRQSADERAALAVVVDAELEPKKPDPPPGLDEDGRGRWRQYVAEHPANRFALESDRDLLRRMIQSEQLADAALVEIERGGQVLVDRFGKCYESPWVKSRRNHLADILRFQRALRLPPSTRMRAESAKLRPQPGGAVAPPWKK